jgi:hypothetical protein
MRSSTTISKVYLLVDAEMNTEFTRYEAVGSVWNDLLDVYSGCRLRKCGSFVILEQPFIDKTKTIIITK